MKIFLINLDRSPDRLLFVSRQLVDYSLAYERIPAVDGLSIDDNEHSEWASRHPRDGLLGWHRGQIGCLQSHRKAWTRAAQHPSAFSLVLEDDVHLAPDIVDLLAKTAWIPKEADIVRIEAEPRKLKLDYVSEISGSLRKCYRLRSPASNSTAYILRGDTAQWLLNMPARYYRPVDLLLFDVLRSPIAKALNIMQINPAMAIPDKFSTYYGVQGHGLKSQIIEEDEITFHHLKKRNLPRELAKLCVGRTSVPFLSESALRA